MIPRSIHRGRPRLRSIHAIRARLHRAAFATVAAGIVGVLLVACGHRATDSAPTPASEAGRAHAAGAAASPAKAAARTAEGAPVLDTAASRQAFLSAYTVFMHPRCMNCHPSGDVPLQGDDSRPHAQNVKRGADGRGLYALACSACHQATNLPGDNMPPGTPTWHLPAADMPLVFEGRSPAELARQLKDPQVNGGKSLDELLHHVEHDGLVLWGWEPGDGRSVPPLSHEQFVAAVRTWIENGAAVPQ